MKVDTLREWIVLFVLIFCGCCLAFAFLGNFSKYMVNKDLEAKYNTDNGENASRHIEVRRVSFMEDNVMDTLNLMWNSYEHEFGACLKFYVEGDTVMIDNITSTKITYSQENVTYTKGCNTGMHLHSHPVSESCNYSSLDVFTFGLWHERDNLQFMCIMCGDEKILCYDSLLNPIVIERFI